MQRGFFVSGVGAQMTQTRLSDIAHNMANVNTAGYLASQTSFSTIMVRNMQTQQGQLPAAYLTLDKQYMDTKEGLIRQTGNDLDFAIEGNGYFRVRAADGQEALTRAGNFRLDGDGNLLTQNGLQVLDSNGQPINLPAGKLTASTDGALSVNGNPVSQLGIVSLKDPTLITQLGDSMFRTPESNKGAADPKATLQEGVLEGSNVNAILEMTKMIDAMRSNQSMLKVVEQYNQQAGLLIDRVGVVQG